MVGVANAFKEGAGDLKLGHELIARVHRPKLEAVFLTGDFEFPQHSHGIGKPPAPYFKPSSPCLLSQTMFNHTVKIFV